MAGGIRATVSFSEPGECPIAAASESAEKPIQQVSTSVTDGSASVTEFLATGPQPERADIEPVFEYGAATVYRVTHGNVDCPCACLGDFGCPVHRYTAEDGRLTLVFHADSFERLQTVIGQLQERHPPVDVRRLLRPPLEGSPEQRVFVNRGRLTDRQREALETAVEMDYFERPRGANASEVAEALGISQSTLTEHLVSAQRKLLDDILE
jgi:DNA-binding transcriptional ArsR family regulator